MSIITTQNIAGVFCFSFLIGVAVGMYIFDCLVSRPTLRILNEEIKIREHNFQLLLQDRDAIGRERDLLRLNLRNKQ